MKYKAHNHHACVLFHIIIDFGDNEILIREEVMEILKIGRSTLYKLIKEAF